jgi:SAM-dependent methyltransferase
MSLTLQCSCPICGASATQKFQKYKYWIVQCTRCHHQFLEEQLLASHAEQVYGDDYFYGGQAGYPDYLAEEKLIRDHGRRYGKLVAKYMVPGRMLDVGAAAGFVLSGFVDYGWQGDGIEPNAGMAAFGREQLGLNVQAGTLENLRTLMGDRTYDLVSMVQVLPHFYDLRQALTAAAEATNPGGHWLIETWNRDSLSAKLFGRQWHEYSPPSVLHWFSPSDLKLLAESYGFEVVDQGRPQKWINGAHVKSLLGYKFETMPFGKVFKAMLRLLPDNLRIPYPAEDLFWTLFRKRA